MGILSNQLLKMFLLVQSAIDQLCELGQVTEYNYNSFPNRKLMNIYFLLFFKLSLIVLLYFIPIYQKVPQTKYSILLLFSRFIKSQFIYLTGSELPVGAPMFLGHSDIFMQSFLYQIVNSYTYLQNFINFYYVYIYNPVVNHKQQISQKFELVQ